MDSDSQNYCVSKHFQFQNKGMKVLDRILELQSRVVGMNERNYTLVKRNNSRKDFYLANDKTACKEILESTGIPTPQTYCVVENMGEINTKLELIENLDEIVIKPAMGHGGAGILLLKRNKENEWNTPSGILYSHEQIKMHIANILFGRFSRKLNDKVIIEYLLTPHSFFRNIYHRGVPDFRIILLNKQPVLAMLRMPTELSDGKANLHSGAIGLGVDLSTGHLQEGYCQVRDKMVCHHPDSNVRFEGLKIPYWEQTYQIALDTANAFPLNYLGIDIVFDEKYGPMVIEINARPGMQIQNVTSTGIKEVINSQLMGN